MRLLEKKNFVFLKRKIYVKQQQQQQPQGTRNTSSFTII